MENKVQATIFLSQWYPELQIRTDRCSAVREWGGGINFGITLNRGEGGLKNSILAGRPLLVPSKVNLTDTTVKVAKLRMSVKDTIGSKVENREKKSRGFKVTKLKKSKCHEVFKSRYVKIAKFGST